MRSEQPGFNIATEPYGSAESQMCLQKTANADIMLLNATVATPDHFVKFLRQLQRTISHQSKKNNFMLHF